MSIRSSSTENRVLYLIAEHVAACFVTKVKKHAAMPARFVTNEVVTNRTGIVRLFFVSLFVFSLGYHYM